MIGILALSLLLKVTFVLIAGLGVTATLRKAPPSLRHSVLFASLVSALVLPIALAVSPVWNVEVLPAAVSNSNPATSTQSARVSSTSVLAPSTLPASNDSRPSTIAAPATLTGLRGSFAGVVVRDPGPAALLSLWVAGFLGVLAWLAIGRFQLRRISLRAWPLTDNEWRRILDDEHARAGLTKNIVLLSSPAVSTPLTWGTRAPVILLPEDSHEWTEAHRRVVLRHELAHVARGDFLTQSIAALTCAVYWFHPLAWISARRLRAECERACDDRVISLGTAPTDYAQHLLDVARSARSTGVSGILSIAMARPSQLEGRLLAVLNASSNRSNLTKTNRAATIAFAAIVLIALSAFHAVPKRTGQVALPAPSRISPVVITAPVTNSAAILPRIDTSFQQAVAARTGGTLTLDLKTGGNVIISGTDQQQVALRATLGGPGAKYTAVTFRPTADGVSLTSRYTGNGRDQNFSHTFRMTVPRKFNVQVKSAGGEISITDVDGTFSGVTGGGEIRLLRVRGSANLSTGGGGIQVSNSNLTGSVTTGGGQVLLNGVRGGLDATSGSGPVTSINSDVSKSNDDDSSGEGRSSTTTNDHTTTTYVGPSRFPASFGRNGIVMTSAGGDISVPEAPQGARVRTGGGAIRIGPSAGEVSASTGGGSIEIGPAAGSVAATTGAGNVTITIVGPGSHAIDVTSGLGRVILVLPADISATLDLETAYTNNLGHKTRIESDWQLATTETTTWDASEGTPRRYVRARQEIGSGGDVIRVRTVNGNAVIRRAGSR